MRSYHATKHGLQERCCRGLHRLPAMTLGLIMATALQAAEPNVVFFYADDMGFSDIGFNSAQGEVYISHNLAYTPNIDRIFNEGVVFDNYMTHQVCSPSRAGMLTGRHFTEVGMSTTVGGVMDSDIPTIAKEFKSQGYRTGAFGKWHNGTPSPSRNLIPYGFDTFYGNHLGGQEFFDRDEDEGWFIDNVLDLSTNHLGYTTYLIQDHVEEFIQDNVDSDQPFFAYVPWTAVHAPRQVTLSDLQFMCDLFDDEYPQLAWDNIKGFRGKFNNVRLEDAGTELKFNGPASEIYNAADIFDLDDLGDDYPGADYLVHFTMAYALDKAVGGIIAKLEDLGLMEDTIIVFASDNGSRAGDNGPFYGSKGWNTDGGQHVPAAIWWPATLDASTRSIHRYQHLTQYLDWFPTLAAAAGFPLATPNDLDGINLWDHLIAGTPARSIDNPETYFLNIDDLDLYTVAYDGRYKLHYNNLPGGDNILRLYDLSLTNEDPASGGDVAGDPAYAEILNRLIDSVHQWIVDGSSAMSYMKIPNELRWARASSASPSGEVLEVIAVQDQPIDNPRTQGLYLAFGRGVTTNTRATNFLQYDIYIAEGDIQTTGYVVSPHNYRLEGGHQPVIRYRNGIGLEDIPIAQQVLPQGAWVRCIVPVGDGGPQASPNQWIGFMNATPGTYHCYLDNVVLLNPDGSTHEVLWQDGNDTRRVDQARVYQNARYEYEEDLDADVRNLPNSKFNSLTWQTLAAPPANVEPVVTLAASTTTITENAGTVTITATLSETSSTDVTVELGFTGDAIGSDVDYATSGTTIVILAGETTGAVTITATPDAIVEDDEHIIVDAVDVTGAIEAGTQRRLIVIEDEAATDTTPPAAPATLVASAGDGSVSLTWDASSEADFDDYRIYRSIVAGSFGSPLATVGTNSYTDSSVVNGTTYYYVVTAVDLSGNESSGSNMVSAVPSAAVTDSRSISLTVSTAGGAFITVLEAQQDGDQVYAGSASTHQLDGVVAGELQDDGLAINEDTTLSLATPGISMRSPAALFLSQRVHPTRSRPQAAIPIRRSR